MKLLFQFILYGLLLTTFNGWSQGTKKENPILFGEGYFGGASGNAGGFSAGASLNYQLQRSLVTIRYSENLKFSTYINSIALLAFPTIYLYSNLEEVSILYGWRFIDRGHSLSFSLGVSNNNLSYRPKNNFQRDFTKVNYIGIPYEFNIKWFKPVKKRYGIIYGLIPIGRPVGFGHSIGLKVYGNISKYSSGGLAISYGLGWHKKY